MTLLFQKYLEISKGSIVNISCVYGHSPNSGMVGYCMTKAGLEMLTKSSALELAPLGIRVNAVAPATINTNMYRYSGMTNESELKSFLSRAQKNIPL